MAPTPKTWHQPLAQPLAPMPCVHPVALLQSVASSCYLLFFILASNIDNPYKSHPGLEGFLMNTDADLHPDLLEEAGGNG